VVDWYCYVLSPVLSAVIVAEMMISRVLSEIYTEFIPSNSSFLILLISLMFLQLVQVANFYQRTCFLCKGP